MAEEIEFRLPSAIPYAYVNVKGTREEINQIDFAMLAALYANSLSAFQTAELEAAKLIVQGVTQRPAGALEEAIAETAKLPPMRKVGDTVIVGGLEFTKKSEAPFGDMPVPASAEHCEDTAEAIKESLGATEIDDVNAPPWEQTKTAKPKAWESKKPAAKMAVDIDFF